ncbi:MAG TPA: hypothetical protein VE863_01500 [Pyrinomonadaceae bacterium]|jgi:hypothetical protein|nr:hypothetical protein [Pyrinomonadaceae bacterium]
MKTIRIATAILASLTTLYFSAPPLMTAAQTSQDQNQATVLIRGYRTGYSDGYQEGVADVANKANRDFRNKAEYDRADRAFNNAWGSIEDYRDGYRQGYEAGYNAAYDRKSFDSSIPPKLSRRTDDATVQYPKDQNKEPADNNNQTNNQTDPNKPTEANNQSNINQDPNGPMVLPRDTIMRIELMNSLSTEASQKGDRFQARVIEPNAFQGAMLDGHLEQVQRPGKAKGKAELQLAFDKITMPSGRSSKVVAQVIEVIPMGSSQGVGKVDPEGGVNGTSSTTETVKKVGIPTGIGAAIGAIFGGGAGAAIGAGIGAGIGTAGVLTSRGKDIYLSHGQHLRIRTNADAEIQ